MPSSVVDEEPSQAKRPGGTPVFEPVRVRRGYQEIYDQVRREIAAGRLSPGDRLPAERDMAEMFGVARQSVREALRALEVSGLITSKLGVTGGAFIENGDPAVVTRGLRDLAHLGRLSPGSLLEARILLTGNAIRLACERATDDDFDRIELDIDETERLTLTGEWIARSEQLVNFYHLLGESTHNEVFALLIDALSEIVQARLDVVGRNPRSDVVGVRRTTLAYLRERDADSAVAEIVQHLERLELYLLEQEKELERKASSGGLHQAG